MKPAFKLYEDENIISFLDIFPIHPGHALIVPKRHYKMMVDTPDELLCKVFTKSKELMKGIKKVTKADFIAVTVVGIDVPHFHVHLVPRYLNDGMANFWPSKKYGEGEEREIAEKIRKALG
ncbi:HIT family protein [Patescibacteria group bacterium]|nr:HIT family protein [Patescibacteria group bacterium]